jgi:hypothetical protein
MVVSRLIAMPVRTASLVLRPVARPMVDAAEKGLEAAVGRVLDSPATERIVVRLFDSGLIDLVLAKVQTSDALWEMIDEVLDRIQTRDSLWRLIDEVAQSPAVAAAVSQQGLGFANQVGDQVRSRSRRADDWLERTAQRLIHRQAPSSPASSQPNPT